MKKVIKKAVAKKPMSRKPMMRSGGAKRTLRKYQGDEDGSEVGPPPAESTAKSAPSAKSFSELYIANKATGLSDRKARKYALLEAGLKKRVDPNAVINAVGNTAGAVGSAVNAFRPQPSGPGMKKGGTIKKLGCAKCGKMMSKGGAKKMAKGGMPDKIMGPAKKPFAAGIPYYTGAGQTGPESMKKGGAMSKINRAVKPGCRGGMVKDANGNCVEVRKAKVGGSLKPVPAGKVGLSKLPTAVRNKMGYQKSGGMMKKAAGGPILDKLKAKLAAGKAKRTEKKINKPIIQGLKAQYKQKKKLGL